MSYDANILRRATAQLEEAHRKEVDRTARLRAKVYDQQPRIRLLDRQLQATMSKLVATALRNGESPARAVRAIREENLDIQQERADLLAELGLAADALDEHPLCPLCNDTGWRGATMCQCLKKLCAKEQIAELSKMLDLGEQSFDTFDLDYYSNEYWPSRKASPRENMELVYEICLNYAEKFGKFPLRNLLLVGTTGLGKTFLSACIARTVSEKGFSVVYDTAGSVFDQFRAQRFGWGGDLQKDAQADVRRYLNCDLLILDDLGTELVTQPTQAALYELINTRLVSGKHTVISTNLTMDRIGKTYLPQIVSRLDGEYRVLHFFGDDIRVLKKRARENK